MRIRDIPTSYERAARVLGTRDRRKICNNTHLVRRSPTTIAVRHHWTDLVTWHADGMVTLVPYNSVTSKVRISAALGGWATGGWWVSSDRGRLGLRWRGTASGSWWSIRNTIVYDIANRQPVTLWSDGRTSASPRRPSDHKAMCKCPRCYRYSKYECGWRQPWRDAERVWMILTAEEGGS